MPAPQNPFPRKRNWVAPLTIALIVAVIGAVIWSRHTADEPGPPAAADAEANWLTRLWSSGTELVTGNTGPQPGQPERKGPIAPGLKLAAAFPYPDDPTQARAAIGYGDNPPQLFKPDDVVAGEYTLQDVEIGYVTLDKRGKTFYLYREYTPEELARRKERQEKHQARVEEKRRREADRPKETPQPVTLEDGRIYIPVVGGPDLIKDPRTGEVTTADGQPAEEPPPPPEEPTESDKEFERWWKENVPEDMQEQPEE